MFRRAAVALTLAVGILVAASGCTGTPAPVETTADALTEDEAFAAAEETYRAYVDALNQVDLADPETFEAVYALTTGEANADFRESFSNSHAEGKTVSGLSEVTLVAPAKVSTSSVTLAVCIDVSTVDVVDATGASTVDPNRPDVQPMHVIVDSVDDGDRWRISRFEGREGSPQCPA